MSDNKLKSLLTLPVIVAALGYFVDIYDLLLFSIVRQSSLTSMGVPEAKLLETGEFLLRIQMGGLLLGGLLWGIMGDKRGRLSVLFGSILLYSLANIANGFATTVEQYAWLRFIAGIGLAGELGAGITLVSETLPKEKRGYGTTIVAAFGLMGAVLANFVSRMTHPHWEIAYFIGGGLGLLLLIARVSILESGIFLKTKDKQVERGHVSALFSNRSRFKRFAGCIFIGLPIWYAIGILITFSPEFARALGIAETAKAGDAVMISYIGLAVGDIISGLSSQLFRTRKKVVTLFIFLTLGMVLLFLFPPVKTLNFFYFTCFMLGVSIGYWALFVTIAAEQFGTNLRSTVATSVPNFIRGTVIPLTLFFKYLRLQFGDGTPNNPQGVIFGALAVGIVTIIIALIALRAIDETFGRDLNYEETD
jgi:MFS transporter, putative metabolite:H+ symporter